MFDFIKTLSPDATAHLIGIAIIAALSVVLIVSDYHSRAAKKRDAIQREHQARKEAIKRNTRQLLTRSKKS